MSPLGPKHFLMVLHLDHRLKEALGGKALVAVQSPLRLSEDSEPEPDLMVLKGPLERYGERLPTPEFYTPEEPVSPLAFPGASLPWSP
ncbi:Uma2 family endonuclease [Thermus oshimai]|uniref:Uma2 family endonuclease n=1 Tax=Thermus TaxID=270 RepID=UPI0003A76493|nr:Uma2 family endonuclease [Thermus oshimai]